MENIFSSLGVVVSQEKSSWQLTSPSWRVDLEQEVDAIEEIARIVGYDSLPISVTDRIPMERGRDVLPMRKYDSFIRSQLIAVGFSECVSTPMLPRKQAEIFHSTPVEVMNPLTVDLERMRPSILPNLLDVSRRNERYGAAGQRLFEIGGVFNYSDKPELVAMMRERTEIAILLKDVLDGKNAYNAKEQRADIYTLRSVVDQIIVRSGIMGAKVSIVTGSNQLEDWPDANNYFDPNEFIVFTCGTLVVAIAGKLNSSVQKEYALRTEAYLAVISYDKLYTLAKAIRLNPPVVKPLPRFPSVERDFALVLEQTVASQTLIDEVRNLLPKELCEDVRIFDEFRSKEMKTASQRSLGIRMTLRAADHTLEDTEVDEISRRVVETIEKKFTAKLRS